MVIEKHIVSHFVLGKTKQLSVFVIADLSLVAALHFLYTLVRLSKKWLYLIDYIVT